MTVNTRKAEHLRIAAGPGVEHARAPASTRVRLRHRALPERDLGDVALETTLLGARLRAPLIVSRDDRRDRRGGGDQRRAGRAPPPSTASRWCSARAARCSTTRRCCGTYRRRTRGRRCCSPTSARSGSTPDARRAARRAARRRRALGPPQPDPGGGPARGRAALRRRRSSGSPRPSRALAPLPGRRQGGRLRHGRRGRRAAARRGRRRGRRRRRRRDELGARRGPPRPARRRAWPRAFADWGVPTAARAARGARRAAPGLPLIASGGVRDGVDGGEVPRARRDAPAGSRAPLLIAAQAGRAGEALGDAGRAAADRDVGAGAPSAAELGPRSTLRVRVVVDRRRARRPRRRAAPAGRGPRRRRARAARAARRPRLPAARRRLHLGHRAVADHDAVGARGDVRRRRPRPAPRGRRCAGSTRSTGSAGRARTRTSTSSPTASAMRSEIARFSARDAARVRRLHGRAEADLRAGHPRRRAGARSCGSRDLARFAPPMVRLGAALPLYRVVARHFEHPRVREAFSFHSLFIGGDPFRVPGDLRRARLPAVPRRRLVRPTAASTRSSRRWRAPLDVRCGDAGRAHRDARRPRDRRRARGRRAHRRRRRRLQRRRAAHPRAARPPRRRCAGCARRCPASCSTSGTDRPFDDSSLHHTLLVGRGYRDFIRDVTRGGRLPRRARPTCTPRRAPSRGWRAAGGDSLCVLLPVPNLRAAASTGRARATGCATRCVARPRDDVRARAGSATRSRSSTA